MKTLTLFFVAALAVWAQNPPATGLQPVSSSVAGGTCTNSQPAFYSSADQKLYTCFAGVWTAVSGGGSPSVGTTLQQGTGTGGFQSSGIAPSAVILNTTPAGQFLAGTYPYPSLPEYCIEYWLTAPMAGDYGQAISAANLALPLMQPTALHSCSPGVHTINSKAVINRPILLDGVGSSWVLSSGLSSAPVTITGCTATAGSQTLSCPSITGLSQHMAAGGIGLKDTNYINATPSGTSVPLALPMNLNVSGLFTSGSATVTGLSSQRGLVGGNVQTITGPCIAASTTITSVSGSGNSLVMSNTATCTANTFPAGFSLAAGQTWSTNLKAVTATPALEYQFNASALRNSEGAMIGAGLINFHLTDPGYRTLTGVQGVHVYGYDDFTFENNFLGQINGAALVMGGDNPEATHGVDREWHDLPHNFYPDSGDGTTGQCVIHDMTGYNNGSSSADENYGFKFHGGSIVFPQGCGLAIGTYNSSHWTRSGLHPRQTTIGPQFQIEGGSHGSYGNIQTPFDLINILTSDDITIDGCHDCGAMGYGHAAVNLENFGETTVTNSDLHQSSKTATYNVTISGSTVTYATTTGYASFDPSGFWDGLAGVLTASSGTCSGGCNVYFSGQSAVSSDGTTLTLAGSPGASGTATLVVNAGTGYYVTIPNTQLAVGSLQVGTGNAYYDMNAAAQSILGLSNHTYGAFVGQGFFGSFAPTIWQNYNSTTMNTAGGVTAPTLQLTNASVAASSTTRGTFYDNQGGTPDFLQFVVRQGSGSYALEAVGGFPPQGNTCTAGTNVTSCTCSGSTTCDVNGGSYSIVGGTATTGTIATINWPTTYSTAPRACWVSQNGGAALYGIGHGTPSTTGMTVTAGIAVTGVTVQIDYGCKP